VEAIVVHLISGGSDIEINVYSSEGKLVKRLNAPLKAFMSLQRYCESLIISKYVYRAGGLMVIHCGQGVDA